MITHDIALIAYQAVSFLILYHGQFNQHFLFHVFHLITLQFSQSYPIIPKPFFHYLSLVPNTYL